MDLETLKIRYIKEEPLDIKEDFNTTNNEFNNIDGINEDIPLDIKEDFNTTNNEFDNIDGINEDIVTYLDVTLENQSDEDKLYDSDLDQGPCDGNNEHNQPFTCDICKKGFRTYRCLQVHSKIHKMTDFSNMSICTICNKKFEARKLTHHFRAHNVKKSYHCYYCSYSCFTQSHLNDHITNCHATYTCNKCSISFKKETELKNHYKSHNNEHPYACSICEQPFLTISNLSRHVRTHNKKRKFNSVS